MATSSRGELVFFMEWKQRNTYFKKLSGFTFGNLFVWLFLLSAIVVPAHASIPTAIGYQGRLANGSGTLQSGTYSFIFRLYTASGGGSPVWTETQPAVTVTDGIFSVNLGSITAFSDSVDFSSPLYLTTEVNGDGEMTPRIALTTSPYAKVSGGVNTYSSEPGTGVGGRMYYNTTNGTLSYYDGIDSLWKTIDASSTLQMITARGNTTTLALQFAGGTSTQSVVVQGDLTVTENIGINSLSYSWPSSHGNGLLRDDGSGALTWVTTSSLGLTTDDLAEASSLFYTDERARSAISSNITGITYTSGTGEFSLTAGYAIPLSASTTNWDTAFSQSVSSWTGPLSFLSGTASITQADATHDGYLTQEDWGTFNGKQAALGFTAENIANKDTDGTLVTNSDTKYPSQKAVKTYVDTGLGTKQNTLTIGNLLGTTNQISVSGGTSAIIGSGVTLSLPQNIDTGASPIFSGLTLTNTTSTNVTTTNLAVLTALSLPADSVIDANVVNSLTIDNTANVSATALNSGTLGNAGVTLAFGSFGSITGTLADGNVTDAITVSGGMIDNTPIGTSVASTAVFTSASSSRLAFLGSSSGAVTFQAAATAGSAVYTLPSADGSSGQVLSTNGSGALSWSSVSTGLSTTLTSAHLYVGNGSNVATDVALSGDATLDNTGALTLVNTGISASTYRSVTVDAKGRVTNGTNPTTFSGYGFSDSSANLASALTDETGSGVAVFGTSPTFTTDLRSPLVIGGTGTGSTLTLKTTTGVGTTGADMVFQVGNNGGTEAIRILNSGYVGVGTASPNAQIALQSTTTTVMSISRTTPATPATFQWTPATNESVFILTGGANSASSFGSLTIGTNQAEAASNVLGQMVFGQSQSSKTNPDGYSGIKAGIAAYTAGSGGSAYGYGGLLMFSTRADNSTYAERMRIDSTGYVGIGDTSPLALLTVGSGDLFRVDSSGRVFLPSGGSGAGSLSLSFTGDTDTGIYNSSANTLVLQTGGSSRIVIDGSGRTGINKAPSAAEFEVWNTANTTGLGLSGTNQLLYGLYGSGGNIQLGPQSDSNGGLIYLGGSARGDADKSAIIFKGNGTEYMRIDGNFTGHTIGNVGIGDTTPAAKFVVGNGDLFQVDSSGRVLLPAGASGAGNLALSTTGDTNTGLYFSGADEIRFQTGGADRLTLDASGRLGVGTTSPGYALHVGSVSVVDATTLLRLQDADSTCDFNANTGSPSCGSDATLKKDVVSLDGNLAKVLDLRPVTYRWNTDTETDVPKVGFIAQEVAKQMPELVTTSTWIDGSEKKFLNMGGMIPYLVGAIKEQATRIDIAQAKDLEGVRSLMDQILIEQPRDAHSFIAKKIAENLMPIVDFVTLRITAIAGYFDSVHTKRVCVAKSNGGEVCVTGDELDDILHAQVTESTSLTDGSMASVSGSGSTIDPVVEASGTLENASSSSTTIIEDMGAMTTENAMSIPTPVREPTPEPAPEPAPTTDDPPSEPAPVVAEPVQDQPTPSPDITSPTP